MIATQADVERQWSCYRKRAHRSERLAQLWAYGLRLHGDAVVVYPCRFAQDAPHYHVGHPPRLKG